MAGYEEVSDAELLAQGPAFRLLGSEKHLASWRSADFPVGVVRDGNCLRRKKTLPGWQ